MQSFDLALQSFTFRFPAADPFKMETSSTSTSLYAGVLSDTTTTTTDRYYYKRNAPKAPAHTPDAWAFFVIGIFGWLPW